MKSLSRVFASALLPLAVLACGSSPAPLASTVAPPTPQEVLEQSGYSISGTINLGAILAEPSFASMLREHAEQFSAICGANPLERISAISFAFNLESQGLLFVRTNLTDPVACLSAMGVQAVAGDSCDDCNSNILLSDRSPAGLLLWTNGISVATDVRSVLQSAASNLPTEHLGDAHVGRSVLERGAESRALEAVSNPDLRELIAQILGSQSIDLVWREGFDLRFEFPSASQAQEAHASLERVLNAARAQAGIPFVNDVNSAVEQKTLRASLAMQNSMAIGMIAGVGIPAFVQYRRRAAAAEAPAQLQRLQNLVSDYSVNHVPEPQPRGRRARNAEANASNTELPVAPRTPSTIPQNARADVRDWLGQPWQAYGFSLDRDRSNYSYEVEVVGDAITLHAYGDLDRDGSESHFSIAGQRNRADGQIAWQALVVQDETE